MTTDLQTAREQAWARYPNDAAEVLDGSAAPTTRCRQRLCQAPIWWGTTARNHRRCPFDVQPDGTRVGTSHWRTCRDRPGR